VPWPVEAWPPGGPAPGDALPPPHVDPTTREGGPGCTAAHWHQKQQLCRGGYVQRGDHTLVSVPSAGLSPGKQAHPTTVSLKATSGSELTLLPSDKMTSSLRQMRKGTGERITGYGQDDAHASSTSRRCDLTTQQSRRSHITHLKGASSSDSTRLATPSRAAASLSCCRCFTARA
jgi:hypothetical protein